MKPEPVRAMMDDPAGRFNILIAEDEGIIARDLEMHLIKQGYAVSAVVASGDAAIRKAEELRPDLVLMDIVLYGDIDGIEAADRIRRRLDIPVIYLTAYADDKVIERAKLTEPYGYLIKPFESRELHSVIEVALYKHKMEKKVRESEEWLSTILRSIGDGVIAAGEDGSVKFMNTVAEQLTGWALSEALGRQITDVFHVLGEKQAGPGTMLVEQIVSSRTVTSISDETTLISRNGVSRIVSDCGAPIYGRNESVIGVVLVFRDVTEQKRLDQALRESEQMLRTHAKELEESNTALKVLLKQRDNDKKELEDNILTNVKQLVFPYIDKMKKSRAMAADLAYLNILESNLKQLISPFSSRLSSKYLGLTPREIAIADLIREGKQDKDIIDILNISFETVKTHRQNIRKKLGIYGKRTNLRTYLLMLSE
ncbi:MAG: response regulator [Nitrospirae bacterium]|nr:response regulator [Nitrospirota bacterium]